MIDRTTISAIAAELGMSWHTVSSVAMRATADLVAAAGPDRLSGVRVIGVDEHRWPPRRLGAAGFVTLIIDLTPAHDQTGPARLLDRVEGRSATVLASWLAAQPADFAQAVEVIAMDEFAGYKIAATEIIPDAVAVMDPFHVVALAGAKLDLIRQRIQQQTLHRRGHTGDPLYGIRRIARTRLQLLSTRQYARLNEVPDGDEQLVVKVAWLIYQQIIAAYADPNRRRGKKAMTTLIESIRRGVPTGLEEIAQLGRTLWRRRDDILAFFDHHLQRPHRDHQRPPPGSPAPQRPRLPKPHPLPLALTPAQRRTPPTRQCTLNYEEPVLVQANGLGADRGPGLRLGQPERAAASGVELAAEHRLAGRVRGQATRALPRNLVERTALRHVRGRRSAQPTPRVYEGSVPSSCCCFPPSRPSCPN
jgi:transposase